MSAVGNTLKYQSTTAVVIDVTDKGCQVEYIDIMARPDLAGRKSGWFNHPDNGPVSVGDIVNVSFTPVYDNKFNCAYPKPTVTK